jgi:hypothetical protein
MELNT